MRREILFAAAIMLPLGGALAQGASSFTQAEVTQGKQEYQTWCEGCHGTALGGGGEVPPLTGEGFNATWSKHSIGEFYAFVASTMPQGLAGDLTPEEYGGIIVYILAANGAKPGAGAFSKSSAVKIGDIADGKIVPGVVAAGP